MYLKDSPEYKELKKRIEQLEKAQDRLWSALFLMWLILVGLVLLI